LLCLSDPDCLVNGGSDENVVAILLHKLHLQDAPNMRIKSPEIELLVKNEL
jgi:hypothetical protein